MDEISGMLQKIRTLAVQANPMAPTLRKTVRLSLKRLQCISNRNRSYRKANHFCGKTSLNGYVANDNSINPNGANAGDPQSITLQVGSNKGDTIIHN